MGEKKEKSKGVGQFGIIFRKRMENEGREKKMEVTRRKPLFNFLGEKKGRLIYWESNRDEIK